MDETTPKSGGATAAPRPPRRFGVGPGLVITASFIGPGTLTTATLAGSSAGYALLWAVVFSILATIVIQTMSARLGLVTRSGLGTALRTVFTHPLARGLFVALVVSAIGVGGAAYAGGDTIGTSLAVSSLLGLPYPAVVIGVGVIIIALLASGVYKLIERVLLVLVAVMSAVFVLTAIVVRPDVGAMLTGMVVPSVPAGTALTVIALIGTTIVPYNLFLHSNLVQEKWSKDTPTDVAVARAGRDTALSMSVGGLITLAIVVTAAGSLFAAGVDADSVEAMAVQLRPLLGPASEYVFALGLFAAGLTSAVAGPLGGAYAISSSLGWSTDLKNRRFQAIWSAIVLIGMVVALSGGNPLAVLLFAQATNGVLLPVIVVSLLVVMNRRALLGEYRNGPVANVLGGLIVVVVSGLGGYQVYDVLSQF